jgi:hypothetical protein
LALASQVQREVTQVLELAGEEGKRLATVSLNTQLRFTSKEQRAKFTEELERAVVELAAKNSAPYKNADGSAGQGRAFRLVLGCYPIPGARESGTRVPLDEKEQEVP